MPERKTTSATAKGLSEIIAVATTFSADGVECLRPACGKGGLIKESVRTIQLLATELLKGQKQHTVSSASCIKHTDYSHVNPPMLFLRFASLAKSIRSHDGQTNLLTDSGTASEAFGLDFKIV